MMKHRLYFYSGLLCSFLSHSCAPVSTATSLSEAAPTGTVVAQGSLSGQNQASVSGSIYLYESGTEGSYALRVEAFSAPDESGLYFEVMANTLSNTTEKIAQLSAKSTAGDQNYFFSSESVVSFVSVRLISSQAQPSKNLYATATLDSVGSN